MDNILANFIGSNIAKRVQTTSNLSQIVQIVANIEHLEVACVELERSLTLIRCVCRANGDALLRRLISFVVPHNAEALFT